MRPFELQTDLVRLFKDSGLPSRAANRMASEWCAHLEDLNDELSAAGLQPDERDAEIRQRMGDIKLTATMLAAMPASQWLLAGRHAAAVAARWSGASVAGLVTTLCLFAAMNHAIAL